MKASALLLALVMALGPMPTGAKSIRPAPFEIRTEETATSITTTTTETVTTTETLIQKAPQEVSDAALQKAFFEARDIRDMKLKSVEDLPSWQQDLARQAVEAYRSGEERFALPQDLFESPTEIRYGLMDVLLGQIAPNAGLLRQKYDTRLYGLWPFELRKDETNYYIILRQLEDREEEAASLIDWWERKLDEAIALIPADADEREAAAVLFEWTAMAMEYDLDWLAQDMKSTLEAGRGVCNDYARLYRMVCQKAGVQVQYITGWYGDVYHAWNRVFLDGRWLECGPTEAGSNRDIIWNFFALEPDPALRIETIDSFF